LALAEPSVTNRTYVLNTTRVPLNTFLRPAPSVPSVASERAPLRTVVVSMVGAPDVVVQCWPTFDPAAAICPHSKPQQKTGVAIYASPPVEM
jgi:hypothetical protein